MATGTCQPGTPLSCDDHNPCNGVETCDTLLGCQIGSIVHEISGKVKKYHVKAQAPRAGPGVTRASSTTRSARAWRRAQRREHRSLFGEHS